MTLLSALLLPWILIASPGATPIVIDTDMGPDDVMAIAMLLSHPELPVEAITVVDGLAHVPAGTANARRLVAASGRRDILVLEGRQRPLQYTAGFPKEWRDAADQPLTTGPAAGPKQTERAEVWLARRLKDASHPVRILALGPLTNLAVALAEVKPGAIEEIVMMGGAFQVRGNANTYAEWNFYVDPKAAERVFASGVPIRVVPLDATNSVKLDEGFVRRSDGAAHGLLGEIVKRVLANQRKEIRNGEYYAWDPLAAAALLDPKVATWRTGHVAIRVSGNEQGRSVIESGRSNATIAVGAGKEAFERIFAGIR